MLANDSRLSGRATARNMIAQRVRVGKLAHFYDPSEVFNCHLDDAPRICSTACSVPKG